MSPDPDFTPGAVRAVLEALDASIAQVESNVLEGRCKSWEEIQKMLGRRAGLIEARSIQLKHMDDEIKKRLGIRP